MKKIFTAIALCLVFCSSVFASGLSTGFSEVTLENLQTGKTYNTKDVANLPLTVVNTGKEPVDLKIELMMPAAQELKKGYEPIPDLSWIKLDKTQFNGIKPQDSAVCEVVIVIPDDAKYLGKKYQVFIWSHTFGTSVGVGLKSKLLLSILGKNEKVKE